MNIGALARRHGTTALLSFAIAGFGTATALAAGSPPAPVPVVATATAVAKARPANVKVNRIIRIRHAQAVPFFAFPPRI